MYDPAQFSVSGTFTRPADTTAYASGDLMANSTTAGSVVPMTLYTHAGSPSTFRISRVKVRKSGTSVTTCTVRVHFYIGAPTSFTNGDNAAWSTNNVAGYIGSADVVVDRAFSDGAAGTIGLAAGNGPYLQFALRNGDVLAAVCEARSAYTPANAEVFTISPEMERI